MIDLKVKYPLKILGIMSGTSLDGFDFAVLNFRSAENFEISSTKFVPFSKNIHKKLEKLVHEQKAELQKITEILYEYSDELAEEIKKIEKVDLIGVHGQTIFHDGDNSRTWQLVSSQLISKKTGIPTVSNFRIGDTAFGGQGAPLVPYFDYKFWNKPGKNQCIINLGGIANGTFLSKNSEEIIAFDFGPANTFVDQAMEILFQKKYDKNGKAAFSGKIHQNLLKKWINNEKYFKKKYPKSTGREYFSRKYAKKLIFDCQQEKMDSFSIISTISAFTFFSIFEQIKYFNFAPEEIYLNGGGALNLFFVRLFKEHFTKVILPSKEEIEFKEAIIFAHLAHAFIKKEKANVPSVTGAKKATVLGEFSF
jgi:anhydro-N-acetylmuramic acid kinase